MKTDNFKRIAHRFSFYPYRIKKGEPRYSHICWCIDGNPIKPLVTRKPHGQRYAARQLIARLRMNTIRKRITARFMEMLGKKGVFSSGFLFFSVILTSCQSTMSMPLPIVSVESMAGMIIDNPFFRFTFLLFLFVTGTALAYKLLNINSK